jgi:hypothetical protein
MTREAIVCLYRTFGSAGRFLGRGTDALRILELVKGRRWWRCVDELDDQASDLNIEFVIHLS